MILNPSPIVRDSQVSRKDCLYCHFEGTAFAVTVESQERSFLTAAFEHFQAQLAVARADFAEFYCQQAM